MPITLIINPGGGLQGRLRVPGDKSISHRAIMLGAIAEGMTELHGFLEGEDTLATLAAFQAMGVAIDRPAPGHVRIQGVGLRGLKPPSQPLYLGNSGTSMRLLAGLLAGQAFDSVLTGDASLSKRPMQRIVEPLSRMQAQLQYTAASTPPLSIIGGRSLRGITYVMPVASAQVKSCLLLAGIYAEGRTCLIEPGPTRDHTECMLERFGYPLVPLENGVCIDGGGRLQGAAIRVPADLSSAAFFLVGATIARDADLMLEQVGVNPTRTGVIDILRLMGADLSLTNPRDEGGEPVADIRVRTSRLRSIEIPKPLVPLAIDEFPVLFVAAACAEGVTVVKGAQELRYKESDRIQTMACGLRALGIHAQATKDGMIIEGGTLTGGCIDSQGDHRVAMAFAMAALSASDPIEIRDCENINTSFPRFAEMAHGVGLDISVRGEG